jgi:hypothetical protein
MPEGLGAVLKIEVGKCWPAPAAKDSAPHARLLPTGKVITDDGPIQNIADGRYRLNCTAHSRRLPGVPAY